MQTNEEADRERFVAGANAISRLAGCRLERSGEGILSLDSHNQLGGLRLTVTENSTQGPGAVFAASDQPQVASRCVGCNEYSGKWNHYGLTARGNTP